MTCLIQGGFVNCECMDRGPEVEVKSMYLLAVEGASLMGDQSKPLVGPTLSGVELCPGRTQS